MRKLLIALCACTAMFSTANAEEQYIRTPNGEVMKKEACSTKTTNELCIDCTFLDAKNVQSKSCPSRTPSRVLLPW